MHLSYYVSNLGMNYNNVFGFLLFIIFHFQVASGLLLSCYYSDYYNIAFDSMIYLMTEVNIGFFFRFLHVTGVSLFILFIFIHVARGLWIKLKNVYLDIGVNIV